jgi:hypothetical protein
MHLVGSEKSPRTRTMKLSLAVLGAHVQGTASAIDVLNSSNDEKMSFLFIDKLCYSMVIWFLRFSDLPGQTAGKGTLNDNTDLSCMH